MVSYGVILEISFEELEEMSEPFCDYDAISKDKRDYFTLDDYVSNKPVGIELKRILELRDIVDGLSVFREEAPSFDDTYRWLISYNSSEVYFFSKNNPEVLIDSCHCLTDEPEQESGVTDIISFFEYMSDQKWWNGEVYNRISKFNKSDAEWEKGIEEQFKRDGY